MTWIKLNDNTTRHPKVARLSDKAFRVWIGSLCYASEFLTDGVLPLAFLVRVKQAIQDELVIAALWDVNADASVSIHDYLGHQTSREKVENKRQYARGQKQKVSRNLPTGSQKTSPPDAEAENRRQKTEDREQKRQSAAAPALIVSPKEFERRKQQCVFVGSRLEVPHGLHADLRKSLGGADPDAVLYDWYLRLNEGLEASGEAIAPDVFKWLKARYALWKPAVNGKSIDEQIDEWARS